MSSEKRAGRGARSKLAVISTSAVEVNCRACGDSQPNPDDGGHIWRFSDLQRLSGERRTCVSCEEPLVLHAPTSVPTL